MSTTSSEPSPGHGWTPQQWLAVSSPHRIQLLALLDGLGEATVNELAELSGRTAQSLYPHLDALVNAGFLVMREPAETGKRSRIYARGPALSVAPVDPSTGNGNSNFADMGALVLHDASARLRRYGQTTEGVPNPSGFDAPHRLIAELTWLDDDRRRELNGLFTRIREVIQEGRVSRSGRRTNVLLYHFPDVTLREAKSTRRGEGDGQTNGNA